MATRQNCTRCNNRMRAGALRCPGCGARIFVQQATVEPVEAVRPAVVGLLAQGLVSRTEDEDCFKPTEIGARLVRPPVSTKSPPL